MQQIEVITKRSQKYYAINPEHLTQKSGVMAAWGASPEREFTQVTTSAIGVHVKSGVLNVTEGIFSTRFYDEGPRTYTHEDLLENVRSVVGMTPYRRWNGTAMWAKDGVSEYELGRLSFLKEVYNNYPNLPEDYEGWYSIRDNSKI